MRNFILSLVVLAVPAYAVGQDRDRSERSATGRTAEPREDADPAKATDRGYERRGDRSRVLPPHPASIPFPNVGPRPFPNVGPQPFPNLQHRGLVQPSGDVQPRYRRPSNRTNVVFVPYASPVVIEREVVVEREVHEHRAPAPVIVERPVPSRLVLDVHPPEAQIFADGYYIGIPDDFRFADGGALLEPGPHTIDIRARGYEPVSFDINLAQGQSATFRQRLTPIGSSQPPAPGTSVKTVPPVKEPTTFYLVPGCYMGNVPPKDANLPATCDISRAVSFQY